MAPTKVALHSLSELKATLDDHIPVYLANSNTPSNSPLPKSQRFTQSHQTTYVRLAMGYSAVSVAAIIFYLDYVKKVDFHDIKTETTAAVIVYFFLNGILQIWLWFGENGEVFNGVRDVEGKTKQQLRICSMPPPKKYDPVYTITIYCGTPEKMDTEKDVSTAITKFFTSDGYFAHSEFENFLRTEIPLLKNAPESKQIMDASNHVDSQSSQDEDVGETIIVKTKPNEADGANETPRKRGRPRKSHA